MTLTSLAYAVGVSSKTLAAYEKSSAYVREDVAQQLSDFLDFKLEFLQAESIESIPAEAASFRARRSITAGQRKSALAAGRIGIEFYEWVDVRFNLPTPNVPTLEKFSPEDAAAIVRHRWGLGNAPAPNMVHLLESQGFRVLSLPVDTETVDAFSAYWNARPYVFLTLHKSAERSRFDAAHELAHFVLHSCLDGPLTLEHEAEADRFAAAFLMPSEAVIAHQLRHANAGSILKAKRIWGVAAIALARRLFELGQLTEWEYRLCCVELSKRGFRSGEPHGIDREKSLTFQKVLGLLRSRRESPRDVAKQLYLTERDLHDYTFGLAVAGLTGGGRSGAYVGDPPQLRVVPPPSETHGDRSIEAECLGS